MREQLCIILCALTALMSAGAGPGKACSKRYFCVPFGVHEHEEGELGRHRRPGKDGRALNQQLRQSRLDALTGALSRQTPSPPIATCLTNRGQQGSCNSPGDSSDLKPRSPFKACQWVVGLDSGDDFSDADFSAVFDPCEIAARCSSQRALSAMRRMRTEVGSAVRGVKVGF